MGDPTQSIDGIVACDLIVTCMQHDQDEMLFLLFSSKSLQLFLLASYARNAVCEF